MMNTKHFFGAALLCAAMVPHLTQAQSEVYYPGKKIPDYYASLPKPDTVSVEEMKAGYRKAAGTVWWKQPILEDGNERMVFSQSLLDGSELLRNRNLSASWYFVSFKATDRERVFSIRSLRDKDTGRPDTLLMELARQKYGSAEANERYDGGDVPGRWLTGLYKGIKEPMRYFGFIVGPYRLFYQFRKGHHVSHVSERCYSHYYKKAHRYYAYLDGYWCEEIEVQMAVLGRDASHACKPDTTLRGSRTYDLLFTVLPDGRLDFCRLAPDTTDGRDRRYLDELHAFVRSLPAWSLEHLYALDGRVFPGRYIRATRTARRWQLYDYMLLSYEHLHPRTRKDNFKERVLKKLANE